MVYVVTRREQWSGVQTGVKFFGSTVLLGAATVLTVCALTGSGPDPFDHVSRFLFWLIIAVVTVKLLFEARVLNHHADRQHSVYKRMAIVMLRDLRGATTARIVLAIAGGVILPLLLGLTGFRGRSVAPVTTLMLVLLVSGELAERYLFFRAAPASRMPGGIR